jgi:hypothetical protein
MLFNSPTKSNFFRGNGEKKPAKTAFSATRTIHQKKQPTEVRLAVQAGRQRCLVFSMFSKGGCQLLLFFQQIFVMLAFASSRFKIKHQVLHVHPKLTEGLLDQVQDPAAATCVINNSIQWRGQLMAILCGQKIDFGHQIGKVQRKLIGFGLGHSIARHVAFQN